MPTTFILPDLPWVVLLGPIVRDARPGDVIVVYTDAMREHVAQVVDAAGRDDLAIRQVEPPSAGTALRFTERTSNGEDAGGSGSPTPPQPVNQ